MACLPVKRPLRCTAHVAVTLGCVQFCRSPKVLENICGSTAAFNIFTFACGKRTPRVCLTCLSSHIPLHLTPIAASPEWHTRRGLVAISRHNGVGRYCRRVRDVDHRGRTRDTDGTKKKGPARSALLPPEWLGWLHHWSCTCSPIYGHPGLKGVKILSCRIRCLSVSIAVYRVSI